MQTDKAVAARTQRRTTEMHELAMELFELWSASKPHRKLSDDEFDNIFVAARRTIEGAMRGLSRGTGFVATSDTILVALAKVAGQLDLGDEQVALLLARATEIRRIVRSCA